MKLNPFSGTFLLPYLLLVILVASCQKDAKPDTDNVLSKTDLSTASQKELSKMKQTDLLKEVRQATSRFHSTTQALKYNYTPAEECVEVPGLGGMGYHWVNQGLVDATFNPLQPEAVLYAPGPGGNLRLIAVEYIVLNVNGNVPRPYFGSQPFDTRGTPLPVDHYSLHVWLYEENPNGLFTPFNPVISCN